MTNRNLTTVQNHIEHVRDLIRQAPMEDKIKLREILSCLHLEAKSYQKERNA